MDKKDKAKLLIQSENISDDLIDWYFELIEQEALAYCHREDIPYGLELVIIQMVADYADNVERIKKANLPTDGSDANSLENKTISSITRGDTTISYTDKSTSVKSSNGVDVEYSAGKFIHNYESRLLQYRKLKTL